MKIKIVDKSLFAAERLHAFQIRFAPLLVDVETTAQGRLPAITFYTVNKEKIEFSIFSITKYDSYKRTIFTGKFYFYHKATKSTKDFFYEKIKHRSFLLGVLPVCPSRQVCGKILFWLSHVQVGIKSY